MEMYFSVAIAIDGNLLLHGFHESAFPCLFCLKLHDFKSFKTNFLGEDPDTPNNCDITDTFYNAKTIMSNVFLWEKTPGEVIFMKFKVVVLKTVQLLIYNKI